MTRRAAKAPAVAPKVATTDAERSRAYRERQRIAAGDFGLVKTFLEGVVADANGAISRGDAIPWLLARAATATEVRGQMAVDDPEARNDALDHVIVIGRTGSVLYTPEQRAQALAEHEAEFRTWLRRTNPAKAKVVASGASLSMAHSTLSWAEGERVAGRSTAASLTAGLSAAKRLLRARSRSGSAGEYAAFSASVQVHALSGVIAGDNPVPYAESAGRNKQMPQHMGKWISAAAHEEAYDDHLERNEVVLERLGRNGEWARYKADLGRKGIEDSPEAFKAFCKANELLLADFGDNLPPLSHREEA